MSYIYVFYFYSLGGDINVKKLPNDDKHLKENKNCLFYLWADRWL